MVDEHGDEYVEGLPPAPASGRMPSNIQPITPVSRPGTEPLFGARGSGSGHSVSGVPEHQLQEALYQSVSSRPRPAQGGAAPSGEPPLHSPVSSVDRVDGATNIYYLAEYQYQITLTAVSMGDHELGLLLPRSGRIWLNSRLFNDVPRGRELATRDAWWRVIDASLAVRFLLGWSISLYRIARFQGVAHERLPNWTRIMCFSPAAGNSLRTSIQLQSDVLCDLTELYAPRARISRQMQAVLPISSGQQAAGRVSRPAREVRRDDVLLRYLADQNNCPATLIQRSLEGNRPLTSVEDYVEFTESILRDIPRLQMQRTVAMHHNPPAHGVLVDSGPREPGYGDYSRLPPMPDPRRQAAFWKLHL